MKSYNELKGGNSADNEFFCTYTNYNMGITKTYPDESLQSPELVTDFPINMAVPEGVLRKHTHALPQMRFLLNDSSIMNLTAQVLYSKARLGTTSASDGSKIVQIKRFLASLFGSFFGIDLSPEKEDRRMALLSDEDTDLICNDAHSYYAAKIARNYQF